MVEGASLCQTCLTERRAVCKSADDKPTDTFTKWIVRDCGLNNIVE